MSQEAPSQYILFDLNGQNVAVTDFVVEDNGRFRMTWVVLDKQKKFSDDEIEAMIQDAFRFLFKNIPEE
jgi:hypothetical protein